MNDNLLIKDEIIKYQEIYIEELEQEIALLKRTILKQKKDMQTLLKQNMIMKKNKKCCDNNCTNNGNTCLLGYNPYQE